MKNTFGNAVSVTIFGESHGAGIGVVVDGLAPGLSIDEDFIRSQLALRRPSGTISTPRQEQDRYQIVSGVHHGHTTGTPICFTIYNEDTHSSDYSTDLARPGHADYTAQCKYHGAQDARGGGHFSGRITAALVAAGALIIPTLRAKGIEIGTHISRCAGIDDATFDLSCTYDIDALRAQIQNLNKLSFAVLDEEIGRRMTVAINAAKADGDSVGGILETAVVGLPAGLGEPWFDTLESMLSHALFSIPAVKGIEFGLGFDFADMRGSAVNDPFRIINDRVVTTTNNNGGINGGISNGMPLLFRCVIKPTPSIEKVQSTVDFVRRENVDYSVRGRHDPCIVHRARVVVDSVCALVLTDLLTQRYGTEGFWHE